MGGTDRKGGTDQNQWLVWGMLARGGSGTAEFIGCGFASRAPGGRHVIVIVMVYEPSCWSKKIMVRQIHKPDYHLSLTTHKQKHYSRNPLREHFLNPKLRVS